MAQINIREIIGSKSQGIDAHMVSVDDLVTRFDTDIDRGLTEAQAKENLKKYGPNKMKNMRKFAMVQRENDFKEIKTEDLVPGDILLLVATHPDFGYVSGDIRIVKIIEPVHVESYFLYKDCHNFCKEMTAEKTSEDPLETSNLIFHGTSLSTGRCLGMVFQTGENMVLNEVSPDLLVDPALVDSDNEENEEPRDERLGEPDITFHEDTIEKLCETYNTDVNEGMTAEQVAINQGKSGKNKYLSPYVKIQNYTRCKRDGEFQTVLSKWLTIGDIISMKGPQIVPADVRIIEASEDCKVDKGGLTGESEPQKVSVENTDANPLNSENLVFATTKITTGTCTGIVALVGTSTVSGRVSGLGGSLP